MKDLRIVIVSWNVEKLLGQCLRSIPSACKGLDWEVVVVDNASQDGSVDIAKSSARVIANSDNRGFAKACNQGIAGFDARYVLLLNPDTECPPGSLHALVQAADANPDAGILGPQLTHADGSSQQSVRSFPGMWNQVGILLKLHHLFPFLFRNYFQGKDQVMGACFLIRRALIEQVGGLDERFFIWFEEVDYCHTAKKLGWDVAFVPGTTVIHHGGQSFAQVFTSKKQRMFNDSVKKYFHKWHPGWRARLIAIVAPVALFEARIVGLFQKHPWMAWLKGIALLEAVSLATVFHPVPRAAASIAAGAAMAVLAMKRPALGLAIILAELAIGSKGALLKIPLGAEVDGGTSLRIILVGSFFLGWAATRAHDVPGLLRKIPKPWLALAALCLWAFIRGLLLKNPALFNDANAWGFLILLLPVLDVAVHDGKYLVRQGTNALVAALVWLPVKTLALLYVWSHGIKSLSHPLYLWVRRTGVGEVTLVTGNLFRVFIQSQVYAAAGALFSTALVGAGSPRPGRVWRAPAVVLIACAISILISLSRSLWVGLVAGALVLGILILKEKGLSALLRTVGIGVASGAVAFGCIAAVVFFPVPFVDTGSLKTLFGSRGSVGDAAAESRWNLLPVLVSKIKEAPVLGSGFGATVTYRTKDPRILAKNPEGLFTTFAFEWGWLEHWIKFGILGIPVMAWLLVSLMFRIWRLHEPWWIRAGFVSSLTALAALHVFTPYLNHPLGFGFLLAAEGFVRGIHWRGLRVKLMRRRRRPGKG